MNKLIALLSISLFFAQCNEDVIYEKHTDPSGNLEWNKDEVIIYDVEIIDTTIKYSISLALRYAVGYAYPVCNVLVKETSPSGRIHESDFSFKTRDEKGYVGDVAGDIIDLELLWKKELKFSEVGTYRYEIIHAMPDPKIHMIMEVGLIVGKVASDTNQ